MTSLLPALLLTSLTLGADFESGKYEWVFTVEGRVQRTRCEIKVEGEKFVLTAGPRDPVEGTVTKDGVAFKINNDANFMQGQGKVDANGWVHGEMSWGQGRTILAKGTFAFAPINNAAQVAALEKYVAVDKRQWEIPAKRNSPEPKNYEPKELKDTLGKLIVSVPPLGGDLKFAEEDASPVTRLFRFEFSSGDVAVLVSTKMRDDRPKDESALLRLESRAEEMKNLWGADIFQYRYFGKAGTRVLEMTTLNSIDSPYFPLSVAHQSGKVLENVAVQQMFITKARMIECAIFAHNVAGEDDAKLLARVTELCSKWRASVSVKE